MLNQILISLNVGAAIDFIDIEYFFVNMNIDLFKYISKKFNLISQKIQITLNKFTSKMFEYMSQKIQITLKKYVSKAFGLISQKIQVVIYKFIGGLFDYFTKIQLKIYKYITKFFNLFTNRVFLDIYKMQGINQDVIEFYIPPNKVFVIGLLSNELNNRLNKIGDIEMFMTDDITYSKPLSSIPIQRQFDSYINSQLHNMLLMYPNEYLNKIITAVNIVSGNDGGYVYIDKKDDINLLLIRDEIVDGISNSIIYDGEINNLNSLKYLSLNNTQGNIGVDIGSLRLYGLHLDNADVLTTAWDENNNPFDESHILHIGKRVGYEANDFQLIFEYFENSLNYNIPIYFIIQDDRGNDVNSPGFTNVEKSYQNIYSVFYYNGVDFEIPNA